MFEKVIMIYDKSHSCGKIPAEIPNRRIRSSRDINHPAVTPRQHQYDHLT